MSWQENPLARFIIERVSSMAIIEQGRAPFTMLIHFTRLAPNNWHSSRAIEIEYLLFAIICIMRARYVLSKTASAASPKLDLNASKGIVRWETQVAADIAPAGITSDLQAGQTAELRSIEEQSPASSPHVARIIDVAL